MSPIQHEWSLDSLLAIEIVYTELCE
jgi:hypothetical protein